MPSEPMSSERFLQASGAVPLRRRLMLLAPLAALGLGGAAFWTMLDRMKPGRFDPRRLDSALLGKPVPAFTLPGLGSCEGFSSDDLAGLPGPVLVNFFASW